MAKAVAQSLSAEAVSHARLAEKAAAFTWAHLEAEYTQDVDKILATLASNEPVAWTLPVFCEEDGSTVWVAGPDTPERYKYLTADTHESIREQYVMLRTVLEILGWEALIEIRQSWYVLTHGSGMGKIIETGETSRGETVTLFPTGADGILGELQINSVGVRRENRWPDMPSEPGEIPAPLKRLEVLYAHNRYVEALRSGDVDGIVAAHRNDSGGAFRSYLTPESTLVNLHGATAIGDYFSEFYSKYRVRDIQLVNRVAESWYAFAELHWVVDELSGQRRTLEFCTAETSPVDPECKFWVRTGGGTNPVEVA